MATTIEKLREPTRLPKLSPRQRECLSGVLQLKSAKQIARDLGISPHAVEKHLRASRDKLGVASSAEAARMFRLGHRGRESPQYGSSDLAPGITQEHERGVLERIDRPAIGRFEGLAGAQSLDHPITPRQTLLSIAAISFASIVGLLLLVACAEGIGSLVSH